ncbi:hypothetical protein NPIL_159021 [Nephila pilipes]|uniref:Uncharacterized protein n=1 Tax=Nephila pilipes TaxID=299642 RepID=A0A8X6P701_NEPPI|nr:hypothetical protein NPIL_159021 [Nephila pilipes]
MMVPHSALRQVLLGSARQLMNVSFIALGSFRSSGLLKVQCVLCVEDRIFGCTKEDRYFPDGLDGWVGFCVVLRDLQGPDYEIRGHSTGNR